MSDNNVNSTENKNNYNKAVQDIYKSKCMQIAIRYGLNDNDLKVSQAIDKYCHEHNCSRGNLTRNAIAEKLKKDGYIDGNVTDGEQ